MGANYDEEQMREDMRRSTRHWLIILLMRHPWLCKYRKTNLALEREKAKKAKEDAEAPIVVSEPKKASRSEIILKMAMLDCEAAATEALKDAEMLREALSEMKNIQESNEDADEVEEETSRLRDKAMASCRFTSAPAQPEAEKPTKRSKEPPAQITDPAQVPTAEEQQALENTDPARIEDTEDSNVVEDEQGQQSTTKAGVEQM